VWHWRSLTQPPRASMRRVDVRSCAKRYSCDECSAVNLTGLASTSISEAPLTRIDECTMTKSSAMIEQLMARVHQQALEMASLRAALDIQFKRIAHMQAELDLLPHARKRRQMLRGLLSHSPSPNGHRNA
jgi:hypothetical protein